MSDIPDNILILMPQKNTITRIREQDTVDQIYFPLQIQFQLYQRRTIPKNEVQGYKSSIIIGNNNNNNDNLVLHLKVIEND
jgi:hypothetical protein